MVIPEKSQRGAWSSFYLVGMSGEKFLLSGDATGEALEKSAGSADHLRANFPAGSGEQFLLSGDEPAAVFTHRGRHRGRLSGSLRQGVDIKISRARRI